MHSLIYSAARRVACFSCAPIVFVIRVACSSVCRRSALRVTISTPIPLSPTMVVNSPAPQARVETGPTPILPAVKAAGGAVRADASGPMAGAAAAPLSALPPQAKRRTLKELREACKSLGLSTNGKKEMLSRRLLNNNRRDDLEDLASQADDDAVVAVGVTGARVQPPVFTKNEFARLFHVLALPSVAAAVVAVRGRLTLQQKDAREDKVDVWEATVSWHFNSTSEYDVQAACAHFGLDPSLHPHQRSGDKLKAKFQEVSAATSGVLVWIGFWRFSVHCVDQSLQRDC